MEREPDVQSEAIERAVRAIHFTLVRRTKPLLHEFGLSTPRFQLLLSIHRNGPLSMSELHRFTHVTGSTVTTLVDGLEEDGLVERYRTNEDRRKVYVRITERGESCIESVRRRRRALLEEALGVLSAEERSTVARGLSSITERLQELELNDGGSRTCDR